MKKYAIGTDIGGSHISCALVNMLEGHIIKDSHIMNSVNNQASADEILNDWGRTIDATIQKVGIENIEGIGFAMPGPFAYDKGIALFEKVAKFESLYEVNVATELSKRLGLSDEVVPLRFMNDASAFAVGEAWLGEAANMANCVAITLGTGFGSAFVTHGLPVVEGTNIPLMGCLWHLPFQEGIADDYFSTRWFVTRWKEISGDEVAGVKHIADAAVSDKRANALFAEFGTNLGHFLGPCLKHFETDILVLGGNIAGAYPLFGKTFETILIKQGVKITIALSKLKEDAAMIGSAKMMDSNYWEKLKLILPKM
jgi:glucokinase